MIGILAHHHMGDGGLGGDAALDQPGWRRGLDHHVLAGSAGVLRPAHHQNPKLGRHDVQPLGAVLADQVQSARAAGAGLVLNIDQRLNPGQVIRQRTAGRPTPGCRGGETFGIALLDLGGFVRLNLLDVFQPQLQLVLRQSLRPAAEPMALHLLEDLGQPIGPRPLGQDHRLQRGQVVREGVGERRHGQDHSTSNAA